MSTDKQHPERDRKKIYIYTVNREQVEESLKVSSWLISVNLEGEQAALKGFRSKNNIAGEVAYCVLTDWSD